MKKLLATLLLFSSIFAFGQTVPQGINYQAIALDQMGQPVPGHDIVGRPIDDAEIGVRLTILENSPTGTLLYQEEHEVLTDLYGMFNLVIGQGLQVSPDPFSSIDWIGDKYLKVELSIENNGSFTLAAVQQLMSVPYAFLAENAMVAQTAIDVDDADADPNNEIQGLSLSNDTIYLSNGGFVVLPTDQVNDADDDPTNEIQGLSISNDTIYLSNGGFVTLPTDQVNDADDDPTNELQVISIANDSIELSNGGKISIYDVGADYTIRSGTTGGGTGWIISLERNGVIQPDFFRVSAGAGIALSGNNSTDYTITNLSNDMDSTNEIQSLSISNDTVFLSGGGFVKLPSNSPAIDSLNDLADAISNTSNLGLGINALNNNTTGNNNIGIGNAALNNNTSGSENVATGFSSLFSNQTGNSNVAYGYFTMRQKANGSSNNAFGTRSMQNSPSGSNNSAFGTQALYQTTGNGNNAFGNGALYSTTSGNHNNAVGFSALNLNTTGTGNTAVGHNALSTNTTGSNNIAIGFGADVSSVNLTNAIAIGAGAVVDSSNMIQLGNTSLEHLRSFGSLTVGNESNTNQSFGLTVFGSLNGPWGPTGKFVRSSTRRNVLTFTSSDIDQAGAVGLTSGTNNKMELGVYQSATGWSSPLTIDLSATTSSIDIGENGKVSMNQRTVIKSISDTASIDNSAALEVRSSTKGLLPPRMTAIQRDAIINPQAGLILYCLDCGTHGQLQIFNGTEFTDIIGGERLLTPQVQSGNISSTSPGDWFGNAVSISDDGLTIAVGAPYNDVVAADAGLTKVFQKSNGSWNQIGSDILGTATEDYSGWSIDLSGSGNVLAISEYGNDDNGADAGRVRVFELINNVWTQMGTDLEGEASVDYFGSYLSLSQNGQVLAIGGAYNDGIGTNAGHVRVFDWSNGSWTQRGADIEGEQANDIAGYPIALSDDGNVVAITSSENSENGSNSGQVAVYQWNSSSWVQMGSNLNGGNAYDNFGVSVSLSANGSTLAIGADGWDETYANSVGQVTIYEFTNGVWLQKGDKLSGTTAGELWGRAVSISADGTIVAAGAPGKDDVGSNSGQVRVYKYINNQWDQIYGNIDGTSGDEIGQSIQLTRDGTQVIIGTNSYSSSVLIYSDLLTAGL